MAEIITDRELRHSIEITISRSQYFLFVVSPYIDLDDDLKKAFSPPAGASVPLVSV